MQILELASKLLQDYPLCDRCLGRQFALLVSGLDNLERGRALKLILTAKAHRMIMEGEQDGEKLLEILATNGFFRPALQTLEKRGSILEEKELECHLCKGRLEEIEPIVDEIVEELSRLRFSTFLVGVKIAPLILDEEDELRSRLGIIWGEEIRNEFSREIGKAISKKAKKEVNHKNPEISILVDPFKCRFQIRTNPIYLFGRYRKLKKGIRQRAWTCKTCNGAGCPKCNGLGGTQGNSIEEILSRSVQEMTASKEAVFRPIGGEDRDTKVLGTGRPFIMEARGAKEISFDLDSLRESINGQHSGIEVSRLAKTTREVARKMTARNRITVSYRAIVKLMGEITPEKLETLEREFSKVQISQRTPDGNFKSRRTRTRYIYETSIRKLTSDQIELKIKCQGGIRIRELLDGGGSNNTWPTVADSLRIGISETQIEVLDVQLEGFDEEIQRI